MLIGKTGLELADEAIAAFCRKWRIRELSLFGSALRDDFRSDSDIVPLLKVMIEGADG